MHIHRYITDQVKSAHKPGTAVMIMGARRVGKTTLIKKITTNNPKTKFYNCDDPSVREQFTNINLTQLSQLLKDHDTVVFDEAQRIKNIGITLKLIVDELPTIKLIVSGSSSLELANEITEPLTGRKKTFYLYPISSLELWYHFDKDNVRLNSYLDQQLRFGSYPDIFDLSTEADKTDYLLGLAQDYLYKDVLEYQDIRNPEVLRRLLSALALQIGQEVSYTELANTVGIDQKTIIKYIDLLEKAYVIFRLPAFSRNMRNEITKSRKIYFYDLGIRNALIRNFNSYDLRSDKGSAWENYLISERIKRDTYLRDRKNYYFWRTYDQKKIDLIEETGGKLSAFEFKWSDTTSNPPQDFINSYPDSSFQTINQSNYTSFITD